MLFSFVIRPSVNNFVVTLLLCDECVCLSVRSHISKTTQLNFTIFATLPLAMPRYSSGVVVICYVLPALWVTLFSRNGVFGASCHIHVSAYSGFI